MSKKPRHWNDDPFTKKARKENYEARSIYKLEEIYKREPLFKGVKRIIDLGAAPGSWTQFCLEKVQSCEILAIDLSEIQVHDKRLKFVQADINDFDFTAAMGGKQADLIISDMAPKTSGIHDSDVFQSFELCMMALNVAREHLKIGGNFVTKIFMGQSFEEYHREMKKMFTLVRIIRPESTRKHSRETFFVGKGKK